MTKGPAHRAGPKRKFRVSSRGATSTQALTCCCFVRQTGVPGDVLPFEPGGF